MFLFRHSLITQCAFNDRYDLSANAQREKESEKNKNQVWNECHNRLASMKYAYRRTAVQKHIHQICKVSFYNFGPLWP